MSVENCLSSLETRKNFVIQCNARAKPRRAIPLAHVNRLRNSALISQVFFQRRGWLYRGEWFHGRETPWLSGLIDRHLRSLKIECRVVKGRFLPRRMSVDGSLIDDAWVCTNSRSTKPRMRLVIDGDLVLVDVINVSWSSYAGLYQTLVGAEAVANIFPYLPDNTVRAIWAYLAPTSHGKVRSRQNNSHGRRTSVFPYELVPCATRDISQISAGFSPD